MKWWAYKHSNGEMLVKRHWDDSYVRDCEESPFVVRYTQPFEANTYNEAKEKAENILNESKHV